MTTNVHWLPQAEYDLVAVTDYYRRISPQLVESLNQEIHRILEQLIAFPASATSVTADLRRICLTRFPFALYYRYTDQRLIIAAMLPQRVDPQDTHRALLHRH